MNEGVFIYVMKMPAGLPPKWDCPPGRKREISEASSERRKRELYYGWKLLEYGAKDSFGFDASGHPGSSDPKIGTHTPDGALVFGGLHCSLSHSGELIAAAFSDLPVGIDVEEFRRGKTVRGIAGRVLTKEEASAAPPEEEEEAFEDWLIRRWTEKESLFKRDGGSFFEPASFDTARERAGLWGRVLETDEKRYHLAAAFSLAETVPVLKKDSPFPGGWNVL